MDLTQWLQNLGNGIRDDLSACAPEWIPIMRTWSLTDDQWASVARQIVSDHRAGPLRFPEIREAARDVLEEAERRRNSERIAELRKDNGSKSQ